MHEKRTPGSSGGYPKSPARLLRRVTRLVPLSQPGPVGEGRAPAGCAKTDRVAEARARAPEAAVGGIVPWMEAVRVEP